MGSRVLGMNENHIALQLVCSPRLLLNSLAVMTVDSCMGTLELERERETL